MKYVDTIEKAFNVTDYPVFTIRDAALALKSKKIGDGYLRLMLHKYVKSGKIKRITRGAYTFHDDAIVVGFAFRPFYYGLESALSMLGVSLQASNNIVMTTRNVRTGIRAFQGRNYEVVRISSNLLFGFSTIGVGNFWVPVSDLEKTLVDMLYLNIPIREELYHAISKKLDRIRFDGYIKKLGQDFEASANEKLKQIERLS